MFWLSPLNVDKQNTSRFTSFFLLVLLLIFFFFLSVCTLNSSTEYFVDHWSTIRIKQTSITFFYIYHHGWFFVTSSPFPSHLYFTEGWTVHQLLPRRRQHVHRSAVLDVTPSVQDSTSILRYTWQTFTTYLKPVRLKTWW